MKRLNIDQLEKLAKEATEGPWRFEYDEEDGLTVIAPTVQWDGHIYDDPVAHYVSWKDMRFIIGAHPGNVLRMIAIMREMAGALEQFSGVESVDNALGKYREVVK